MRSTAPFPVEGNGSNDSCAFTAALRGEPCHVLGPWLQAQALPVQSWLGPATLSDKMLLSHCGGATLDIGCGPGRMTQHLAAQGRLVLGIDVVPEAVALTRARGSSALLRDVFGRVPGEGRWDTALLADGNIGIGGDPVRLLGRVRRLISCSGRVVVDLAPPGVGLRMLTLTLVCAGVRSAPFPWSLVGADTVGLVAAGAGLRVVSLHEYAGRWFAVLARSI